MQLADRYEMVISWSDEDECYIANVPDLKFFSAWGNTREQALAEIQEALTAAESLAQKQGKPLPPARTHPLTV